MTIMIQAMNVNIQKLMKYRTCPFGADILPMKAKKRICIKYKIWTWEGGGKGMEMRMGMGWMDWTAERWQKR